MTCTKEREGGKGEKKNTWRVKFVYPKPSSLVFYLSSFGYIFLVHSCRDNIGCTLYMHIIKKASWEKNGYCLLIHVSAGDICIQWLWEDKIVVNWVIYIWLMSVRSYFLQSLVHWLAKKWTGSRTNTSIIKLEKFVQSIMHEILLQLA